MAVRSQRLNLRLSDDDRARLEGLRLLKIRRTGRVLSLTETVQLAIEAETVRETKAGATSGNDPAS